MNITLKQLLVAGGPVIILLGLLSIYSIALMWERWSAYRKTLSGLGKLLDNVRKLLASGDITAIRDICKNSRTSSEEILFVAATRRGSQVEKRESVAKVIEWHATGLHKGLAILATIGSTSPFIGLFGTVLGIIRAFRDLAAYSGAGPGVVAAGIAEALVCTAAGLFVAIPAIIAYNYFIYKSNQFIREMDWISEQVIEKTGV